MQSSNILWLLLKLDNILLIIMIYQHILHFVEYLNLMTEQMPWVCLPRILGVFIPRPARYWSRITRTAITLQCETFISSIGDRLLSDCDSVAELVANPELQSEQSEAISLLEQHTRLPSNKDLLNIQLRWLLEFIRTKPPSAITDRLKKSSQGSLNEQTIELLLFV